MPRSGLFLSEIEDDRLVALIEERLEPGADKERIDERIWDLFGEHWAIMFTDLAGYSRNVEEFGITHFMQVIYESQRLFTPLIEEHDGWLFEVVGDSLLVLFRNPKKAMACALAMQRVCADYNRDRGDAEKVLACIGLGKGDVVRVGRGKLFGQQVNAASKLGEDTAKAGEILVTGMFAKAVAGYPDISFEDLDDFPHSAQSAHRVIYKP